MPVLLLMYRQDCRTGQASLRQWYRRPATRVQMFTGTAIEYFKKYVECIYLLVECGASDKLLTSFVINPIRYDIEIY